MYAEIAINAPVDRTFEYHVPPDLIGQLAPGHLVQVPFGTAMQHGVVLALREQASIAQTKPVAARLDPRPALTPAQIELAWWMHETYLTPIGLCVWQMLPPGITGGHDIRVSLLQNQPVTKDEVEAELVTLLKKRKSLKGSQLNQAMPGKPWRAAVDALAKTGALHKESILKPPTVRPKTVQTVSLAIHPAEIESSLQAMARPSRAADVLDTVTHFSGTLLRTRANEAQVDKLVADGLVAVACDDTVSLAVSHEAATAKIDALRRLEKPRRVLRLLAREGQPVDVTWVYAQTDATLNDLRRLEEEELVLLGEQNSWRDPLAERDFIPTAPLTLTAEQQAAWAQVKAAIEGQKTPAPPRIQGGEPEVDLNGENYRKWNTSSALWGKLKPLAQEMRRDPTPAENRLWAALRDKRLNGTKFRRQHTIERFIVDFYCHEAKLVLEVDGDIHQYTQEEDALRTELLESLGLRVLRFKNEEIFRSLSKVLDTIAQTIQASPPRIRGGERGVGFILLLHGVTGSGKTEIYLRAIDLMLQQSRSAIFLVPEIALTAQTVRRVAARFAGRVAIVHSGLSLGERYDTWRRARDGLIQVVVGARSALFTPLQNVGLIVLDEEHDHSYKQSESGIGMPQPYYHARQVAEEMMRRSNGVVILGSATPDVESSFRARRGDITHLHMPNRIMGHRTEAGAAQTIDLPPVQVVDMRQELKGGNTSIFSRALHTAMTDTLKRGEQVILFINRRGQSTYVFCRDCGYVATCPRCDSPLTHHRQGQALRCHRCSYEQPEPTVCPSCGSKRIKFFGAGTQQVEQALQAAFPHARAVRWDADSADSHNAHERILQAFMDRRVDIMVGTQMVAKGLDLPLVTLVGVVSADLGLALPDFRAGEHTFQVLTQVAGRAGRGIRTGQVILQTYQPGHYVIAAASGHDYETFYQQEIAYRRELGYPPFRRLVRLIFRSDSEMKARAEAERAGALLRGRIKALKLTGTELIGPAPCFVTKVNRFYRWHLLLRGPDPSVALRDLDIPRGWHIDVDPVDVL